MLLLSRRLTCSIIQIISSRGVSAIAGRAGNEKFKRDPGKPGSVNKFNEYQPNFTLYEVKYESMLIAFVENQVAALEDHLSVQSSEVRFENIAAENLKTAAEMFMYLNTCPGNDSLKNWFRSWSLFYDDLFKAHNIDHIILTMNRIIKSNLPPNKDAKVGSVLKRTAKLLSLKLGKIQSLLPGQSRNVTYTDDQSMNTSEGKKIAKVGVSGKN